MNLGDAFKLALDLMAEHKLHNWTFKFDKATTRAGLCKFGPKCIALSALATLHDTEEGVRNTILHEIAHAIAGAAAGHGPVWRFIALSIGCNAEKCTDIVIPQRYAATCRRCGQVSYKVRAPRRRYACSPCLRATREFALCEMVFKDTRAVSAQEVTQ